MKNLITIIYLLFFLSNIAQEKTVSKVWVSDNGDGTYTNPILHSDFSDPDVVRVKDDYYMTASSFTSSPSLPILHSKDLVNWELINYALPKQIPLDFFDKPQHGNGVWAPCIRFHNDEFYIYYPDPDFGIYMIKTKNPKGKWSDPVLVKGGKGLIDPTPLWDDDGKAYLAYAFAGSRAGIKSLLVIASMNKEGTKTNDDEVKIIDGFEDEPTIEGPKFYKRNGYYYIFAPAGGVSTGWQTILRSKSVFGPYQKKKVLHQGNTNINGPHQGAWVTTQTGEDWFIHFQDKDAYGRIVHMQPMSWKNDWPIIGIDQNNDGIGEPVLKHKKPNVGKKYSIVTPPDSDEFNNPKMGLQWQWQANPEVYFGFPTSLGYFTLYCRPIPEGEKNLYNIPNLFLQKFPAEEFTATTKMIFNARHDHEQVGFLIMGLDYSYLKIEQENGSLYLSQIVCKDVDKKGQETTSNKIKIDDKTAFLKIKVTKGGFCDFYYSSDNKKFKKIGTTFKAREGKWVGAKIGFLALRKGVINNSGSLDIDWIRFNK